VTRRSLLALTAGSAFAGGEGERIRGKLEQTADGPVLVTAEGKRARLAGDGPTMDVLKDKRLKDSDFEANGHFAASELFQVDPIHKRNLFVHKHGKRLQISYWCGVCSIRTWSPGVCMCCQDETELDLKERFDP
jgi:hypothetical protein